MNWRGLQNIVFQTNLNGNMLVVQVPKRNIALVMILLNLESMHGTVDSKEMVTVQKIDILIRLVTRNQISGVFMICMGMFGNGQCRKMVLEESIGEGLGIFLTCHVSQHPVGQ